MLESPTYHSICTPSSSSYRPNVAVRSTSASVEMSSPKHDQTFIIDRDLEQARAAPIEDLDEDSEGANTPPQSPLESSSSFVPDPHINIQLRGPTLRTTDVDEAVRRVNYVHARREVKALERNLVHTKLKEVDALNELLKLQVAKADKLLFEMEKELGQARLELTDAKKKAKSVALEFLTLDDVRPEFEMKAMPI